MNEENPEGHGKIWYRQVNRYTESRTQIERQEVLQETVANLLTIHKNSKNIDPTAPMPDP